jgi:acetolactate synthase-1/2/3 large subunit
VKGADDLASALEAAFAAGGVQLVTVPVDYSENKRVLVDELCANIENAMHQTH